jgi:hypothetical protein
MMTGEYRVEGQDTGLGHRGIVTAFAANEQHHTAAIAESFIKRFPRDDLGRRPWQQNSYVKHQAVAVRAMVKQQSYEYANHAS